MRTTRKIHLVIIMIMLLFPSFSFGQYYLWIEGIECSSENDYFSNWIPCTDINYNLPGIPQKLALLNENPKEETLDLAADQCKTPSIDILCITKWVDKSSAALLSYQQNKTNINAKLALCNSKGEPTALFDIIGGIAGFRTEGTQSELTLNFEKIEFTTEPMTIAKNAQNYFLWIDGIEGGAKNDNFKNWIEISSIEYNLPGIPSPMALLNEDQDHKPVDLAANQCKDPTIKFSCVKELDASTPKICSYFNEKVKFQAKLAIVKVGAEAFAGYNFEDAIIIRTEEHELITTFTLQFSKLDFSIEKQ